MTFQPTDDQMAAAMAHAAECQPLECCGLIADGDYHPLTNTATQYDAFVMDRRGYLEVARHKTIEAIVHSHVYLPPVPSMGDRAMCEKLGLPWLIVGWPTGLFEVIEPCGYTPPLIGRQWAWGSCDCWGLVRDAFHQETGIWMPDFPRDWLWWENGQDIITEFYPQAGLHRMPDDTQPRHCDIFGMQIVSKVVNHVGIFLAPDIILHQLMGQLSVRQVYGGIYRKTTTYHLRHESLL